MSTAFYRDRLPAETSVDAFIREAARDGNLGPDRGRPPRNQAAVTHVGSPSMGRVGAAELRDRAPRSWLLVPAGKAERMLPHAYESGADVIILDLEAATPPAERAEARRSLAALRRDGRRPVPLFIRVNDRRSVDIEADEVTAVAFAADGIVMPRVESADEVVATASRLAALELSAGLGQLAIVPMLETGRGFFAAQQIAMAGDRVAAIAMGGEDFAADLGATRTVAGAELVVARGLLAMAAASARLPSVDTPWLDLRDPEGAGREAAAVRALGISGKFLIHPAQVAPVHRAFMPTDDEAGRARAIVAAFDAAVAAGTGIAVYDGKMIDEPIARNAKRTLSRAARV